MPKIKRHNKNLRQTVRPIFLFYIVKKEKTYKNPIEMASILGVFADNTEDFDLTMWISIDKGIYINITPNNADSIIRYLYERYPY